MKKNPKNDDCGQLNIIERIPRGFQPGGFRIWAVGKRLLADPSLPPRDGGLLVRTRPVTPGLGRMKTDKKCLRVSKLCKEILFLTINLSWKPFLNTFDQILTILKSVNKLSTVQPPKEHLDRKEKSIIGSRIEKKKEKKKALAGKG